MEGAATRVFGFGFGERLGLFAKKMPTHYFVSHVDKKM